MTAPRHREDRVRRALVAREDGRVLRRHTIYLTPPTSRKLAVCCAKGDVDLSDVVERAVAAWLSTQEGS